MLPACNILLHRLANQIALSNLLTDDNRPCLNFSTNATCMHATFCCTQGPIGHIRPDSFRLFSPSARTYPDLGTSRHGQSTVKQNPWRRRKSSGAHPQLNPGSSVEQFRWTWLYIDWSFIHLQPSSPVFAPSSFVLPLFLVPQS